MAPLLPKLRGHFAEFLNHSSPERLSILYLTTCVGLGYGPLRHSLEAFLGSIGSSTSPQSATHHVSGYMQCGFAYTTPYTLTPVNPLTGGTNFLRPPIAGLLQSRPLRSTQLIRRLTSLWVVSINCLIMDASTRVREYQPVVHR